MVDNHHSVKKKNSNIIYCFLTFPQFSSSELSLQSNMPLHICEGCIH